MRTNGKPTSVAKRSLALVVVLALLLSCLPAAFAAEPVKEIIIKGADGVTVKTTSGLPLLDGTTYGSGGVDVINMLLPVTDPTAGYMVAAGDNAGEIKLVPASGDTFDVTAIIQLGIALADGTALDSSNGYSCVGGTAVYISGTSTLMIPLGAATDSTIELSPNIDATQKTFKATLSNEAERNIAWTYSAVSDATSIPYGGTFTFRLAAVGGYGTPTVSATMAGQDVVVNDNGANNEYSIENVTGDLEITVTSGLPITYNVSFFPGSGYTFNTESGTVANETVAYNGSIEFTLTVDPTYRNSFNDATVYVNGLPIVPTATGDLTKTYTISNILEDKTVTVTGLTLNTYNVTLASGTGYTFSTIQSASNISYGQTFSFTVTLTDGYEVNGDQLQFTGVAVDSVTQTAAGNVYNCSVVVTEDLTIGLEEGNVVLKTYTITPPSSDEIKGYSINIPSNSVKHGDLFTFEVSVEPGYRVETVAANGQVLNSVNGSYTIPSVTADTTIAVHVVQVEYRVIISDIFGNVTDTTFTAESDGVTFTEDGNRVLSLTQVFVGAADIEKYYTAAGFTDNDNLGLPVKEITMKPNDVNQVFRLTSNFTPNWNEIVKLNLTASVNPVTDKDRYNLTAAMTTKETIPGLAMATDTARITRVGVVFAQSEEDLKNESAVVTALNGAATGDLGAVQNAMSGTTYAMTFMNTSASMPATINFSAYMNNIKNENNRYAVGIVQITLANNEVLTFFTNVVSKESDSKTVAEPKAPAEVPTVDEASDAALPAEPVVDAPVADEVETTVESAETKKDTPVETPEEAPAEEAPVEEVPAEGVPAEEAPAE